MAARCAPTMPAQGASYLQVTNTGAVPAEITRIDVAYVEMVTSSGVPTGDCVVGVGATQYITLTGVGADPATAGELFSIFLASTNGGFASAEGAFG